jgi:formylmethanofuran dehydrogenase subunit E
MSQQLSFPQPIGQRCLREEMKFEIFPIGYISSRFKEAAADIEEMRQEESLITLNPEYQDGLYGIEEYQYLDIIFYFHRSSGYKLIGPRRYGVKGVFACHSPRRPVPIGLTTVELLQVDGNRLLVRGLDAIDETPVLDIKPHI